MAALAKQFPCQAWLWQPIEGLGVPLTRDPAALPTRHPEAVKSLRDGFRGPKFARLVPVQVLKVKAPAALVQEKGQDVRAVPAGLTIPWYEGLLLLSELEATPVGSSSGAMWHREHSAILQRERAAYSNHLLSSANYVKVSLLTTAATGPKVVDVTGREWNHRRNLQADASTPLEDGNDAGGLWRVREVAEYLPPWVAFCHPKCGTYQDYYLIRWAQPYSEVDYGATETGWQEGVGATWEPDECLPTHCDGLRLAAKRRWLAAQQQREIKAAEEFRQRRSAEVAAVTAELGEDDIGDDIGDNDEQDEEDLPALKRRRAGENDPEAVPLWEIIVSAVDFKAYAKDSQFLVDFSWQIGTGSVAKQLMRLIDACIREKRSAVTWAVVRCAFRAANEGPLSARTRLAMETVCDLAKAKRVNLRVVETIICDLAKSVGPVASASAIDGACGAAAWILVHMFPQRKDASWGWSHMGWTWGAWWEFVARCLQGFQPSQAFLVLRTCLELMLTQAGPGALIRDMPTWSDDPQRVRELRRRLCKTSGFDGEKLLRELDHLGIDDAVRKEEESTARRMGDDELEGGG